MNCPKCFSENPSNAVFCQNCGTRIVNISQTAKSNFITIGRAPDNNICINLPGVSNKHARLFFENSQVYIEDLNSTNGTFVNGNRITRIEIKLSDSVNLGQTPFNLYETQIQQLFSSAGTSTVMNNTSIDSGYSYPQTQPYTSGANSQIQTYTPVSNPQSHSYTPGSNQINVNVMTPVAPKSVGVSLLLTFFFGSIGMFYSTTTGGIVMCCVNIFIFLLGFLTLGIAWFAFTITHPICMIWAAIAASETNKITSVNVQTRI